MDKQLEFDGYSTNNFDVCKGAYSEFKKLIEIVRSGKSTGEVIPAPGQSDNKLQQFSVYTGL